MLDWISLHPYWAGAAIFLVSLAESLVGVWECSFPAR